MLPQPIDADAIIQRIKNSNGVIVRAFYSRSRLVKDLQSAINSNREAAFAPKMRSLRHFYNTDGFILVMSEIESELTNHRVLLEPNSYGGRHLFAVGPLKQ